VARVAGRSIERSISGRSLISAHGSITEGTLAARGAVPAAAAEVRLRV
jgi:hypothetical protein